MEIQPKRRWSGGDVHSLCDRRRTKRIDGELGIAPSELSATQRAALARTNTVLEEFNVSDLLPQNMSVQYPVPRAAPTRLPQMKHSDVPEQSMPRMPRCSRSVLLKPIQLPNCDDPKKRSKSLFLSHPTSDDDWTHLGLKQQLGKSLFKPLRRKSSVQDHLSMMDAATGESGQQSHCKSDGEGKGSPISFGMVQDGAEMLLSKADWLEPAATQPHFSDLWKSHCGSKLSLPRCPGQSNLSTLTAEQDASPWSGCKGVMTEIPEMNSGVKAKYEILPSIQTTSRYNYGFDYESDSEESLGKESDEEEALGNEGHWLPALHLQNSHSHFEQCLNTQSKMKSYCLADDSEVQSLSICDAHMPIGAC